MKYALILDNSTQWFAFIVKLDKENNVIWSFPLDSAIETDNKFIRNLWHRELSFSDLRLNIKGQIEGYGGGWISEDEFNRIKRMIEIWPTVREFNRLKDVN